MSGVRAWAGRLPVGFARGAKWWVGAGIFLVSAPAHPAHEASIPSAGEVVLGVAVAGASPGGAWEANPALSGGTSGWRAGSGFTHPMGFSDLELWGLWVGRGRAGWMPGWSLRWSTLEAGELYREDLVGLDLATGAERWQLGGGWRAGRTKFSDERSGDWTQGWAVGLLVRPVERLALGAAWEDRSGIDAPTARLAAPWIYRFGATVAPADSLWATHVGAEGLQEGPLGWSIGQEARWRILVFRAGLRVDPWVLSFGAGVRYGNLVVDWSRQGDPRTGWQHLWTISVAW